MRIFLIGMPGAGKTTVGRKLAELLDYPFLDLDEVIARQEKLSIPEIFSSRGEAYFREVEARSLRDAIVSENLVVASGGGTPCFHNNMLWMNRQGLTVWLQLPVQELVQRLTNKGNLSERPLLNASTPQALETRLAAILEHRKQFYGQAALKLDSAHLPAVHVAGLIVDRVEISNP